MKKLDYRYCPATPILEWLSNKWIPVILLKLHACDTMRYNEIYRQIPSVSEKMVAKALARCVADGLVCRTLYPEVPPKVEYTLSPLGKTLIPHLQALAEWGDQHVEEILRHRAETPTP